MLEIFLLTVLFLVFLPCLAAYYGWAIALLWSWFLVPLGVPEISIPAACGVVLLVGLFKEVKASAKGEKDWQGQLSAVCLKPIIAVVFGWIIKTIFMGA